MNEWMNLHQCRTLHQSDNDILLQQVENSIFVFPPKTTSPASAPFNRSAAHIEQLFSLVPGTQENTVLFVLFLFTSNQHYRT